MSNNTENLILLGYYLLTLAPNAEQLNIIPNGRYEALDRYQAHDKTKQYDPNINQNSILKEGERYLGATYIEKGVNYRNDGSIMYSKESEAYSRMISQSERTGNESMAAITDNGTLVLPDYKNTSSSVDISDYGYDAKNGNIVDAGGNEYNTIATAHTHPEGGGPSTYVLTGYGDLGFAAFSTPYKPVYVLQMNNKNIISLIVASPNMTGKASGFNYRTHTLPGINIDNLLKGNFKLSTYTKQNDFIKLLGR